MKILFDWEIRKDSDGEEYLTRLSPDHNSFVNIIYSKDLGDLKYKLPYYIEDFTEPPFIRKYFGSLDEAKEYADKELTKKGWKFLPLYMKVIQ